MPENKILTGFVLLIILGAYFIPTFIAIKKKDSTAIILINIFLGWMVLGWIIALIWAITSPTDTGVTVLYTCDKCGLQQKFNQRLKYFVCPNCGHSEKFA